jgi:hypothetical protein
MAEALPTYAESAADKRHRAKDTFHSKSTVTAGEWKLESSS